MVAYCCSVLLLIYSNWPLGYSLTGVCLVPSSFPNDEVGNHGPRNFLPHRLAIFQLKECLQPIYWFVIGIWLRSYNFAASRYVRNGIDFLDETVARHAASRQESFVSHRSGPFRCRSVETGSMRMVHVDESMIIRCHRDQFVELSENDRDTSRTPFVRIMVACSVDPLLDRASDGGY